MYEALKLIGVDPQTDMPIISQIKSEVRRLNSKDTIWTKIKQLEMELNFQHDKKRFIFTEKQTKKPDNVLSSMSEIVDGDGTRVDVCGLYDN